MEGIADDLVDKYASLFKGTTLRVAVRYGLLAGWSQLPHGEMNGHAWAT